MVPISIPAKYTWVERQAQTRPRLDEICKVAAVTPVVDRLLHNRANCILDYQAGYVGIASTDNIDFYKTGIDCISEHVKAKKPVLVYGDSDTDGCAATAVMVRTLEACKLSEIRHVIPNRLSDGYGVSVDLVHETLKNETASDWLIVTVDCGTNDTEAINTLVAEGYKVVVTDHHLPEDDQKVLPDTVIVNPKLSMPEDNDEYEMSGCYVAAKVALNVLRCFSSGNSIPFYVDYAHQLVALTILSDQILINDTARREYYAARIGMKEDLSQCHIGLQYLFALCRAYDGQPIDTQFLNFYIIPKLNSAGRMGIPEVAYNLLAMYPEHGIAGDELDKWIADTKTKAYTYASDLLALNNERKNIENAVLLEAIEQIQQDPINQHDGIVVFDPKWHLGVVGIVAARLADMYGTPVIVLTSVDGTVKGSGRAPEEYDLHSILEKCKDTLTGFGGHRGAAGVTMTTEQVQNFVVAFQKEVRACKIEKPELLIDATIKVKDMYDMRNHMALDIFEPYGRGNLPVMYKLEKLRVNSLWKARGSQFFLLEDPENGNTLTVSQFRGDVRCDLNGHIVNVIICPNPLYFTGLATLEYRLVDMEVVQ